MKQVCWQLLFDSAKLHSLVTHQTVLIVPHIGTPIIKDYTCKMWQPPIKLCVCSIISNALSCVHSAGSLSWLLCMQTFAKLRHTTQESALLISNRGMTQTSMKIWMSHSLECTVSHSKYSAVTVVQSKSDRGIFPPPSQAACAMVQLWYEPHSLAIATSMLVYSAESQWD